MSAAFLIYSDLDAVGGDLLRRLLLNPSFQVTFWYSVARFLMLKHNPMYLEDDGGYVSESIVNLELPVAVILIC